MVIYERMSFELERINLQQPEMAAIPAEFTVKGKRGIANLNFVIKENGQTVGNGFKRLLVSGLKPYDEAAANALAQSYLDSKTAYKQKQQAAA